MENVPTLVPAPKAGDQDKFLCADNTWIEPNHNDYFLCENGLWCKIQDELKYLRGNGTWDTAIVPVLIPDPTPVIYTMIGNNFDNNFDWIFSDTPIESNYAITSSIFEITPETKLNSALFYEMNGICWGDMKIKTIGKIVPGSNMCRWFSEISYNSATSFDITALSDWDVSNVTDFSDFMTENRSISDISPISGWNVSNAQNMDDMFANCQAVADFTPLNSWDVSNVTSHKSTFFWCNGILPSWADSSWQ